MIASASPAAVRGSLDPPDATSGRVGVGLKGEDYTILSTIHSAKGQEWRIVRVLNVVDGCIPSDRDHQHAGGDRGRASASLLVSGRQIRAARMLAGLTQADLARAAGCHPRSVRYWENKGSNPPTNVASTLDSIEQALNRHGVIPFSTPTPGVRCSNYVAMTRAKTELDLIVPQRFFTHQQTKLGDRHVYASRSRFVPDTILGSFDNRNLNWRDQTDSSIKVVRKVGSSVDVAASLMRMWQ
jgi:superfamily I DNA/RNA helicase